MCICLCLRRWTRLKHKRIFKHKHIKVIKKTIISLINIVRLLRYTLKVFKPTRNTSDCNQIPRLYIEHQIAVQQKMSLNIKTLKIIMTMNPEEPEICTIIGHRRHYD